MAADRTLMAWIRTSLSLQSFSFSIYSIVESLQSADKLPPSNAARNVGLILAAAGTLAMGVGTSEYWRSLKQINQLQSFQIRRPLLIFALTLCVAGLGLFVGIAMQLV